MDNKDIKKRIKALPKTDEKNDSHIIKARLQYARSFMTWSGDEDQILTQLYQGSVPIYKIAQKLKRSCSSIEARIKALRIFDISKHKTQDNKSTKNEKEEYTTLQTLSSSKQAKQIIRYWRNSLSDTDKMGLSPSRMKQGECFSWQLFKENKIPQNKVKRFFDEAEKAQIINKKRNKKDQIPTINSLQVLIAPYTALKNHEHGKHIAVDRSPDEVLPLWLVATLTREGRLMASEEMVYPWIERKCLTPNEDTKKSLGYPIIGDVSQIDDFYTKEADLFENGKVTWEALCAFAEKLFRSALEEKSDIFLEQNYLLKDEGYILPTNDIIEASKSIISTYDQYIFSKNKTVPPLLEKFCSLAEEKYSVDQPVEKLFMMSQTHLGQMQNKYSLSASQRISLSYLNDPENNEIFTIHGPPGTGKTSLLLSMVATHWVEAAIQKKTPPILVTASTNNLAVINVLEQFNQMDSENNTDPSIRWLPELSSYGLYLVSGEKSKKEETKKFFYRTNRELGSVEKFYSQEYREIAKDYFLEKFNLYYQKSETDLDACRKFIHEQMLLKQKILYDAIKHASIFFNFQEDLINKHGNIELIDDLIINAAKEKAELDKDITLLKEHLADWFNYKTTKLKWLRIFAWLPFIKALLIDHIKLFTSSKHEFFDQPIDDIDIIEETLNKKINELKLQHKVKSEALLNFQLIKNDYEKLIQDKITLEQQLGFEFTVQKIFNFSDPENILCKLDSTIRYDLFKLATHYWEATWLLESEKLNSLTYDRIGRKKYWEIQAMLTPCFVTTLHSGPSFFRYKTISQEFETLADFIDLLIIDEAGQVMPAIAGAMLSVAKRAVLVGDALQIEPICTLTEGIDLANAKKFKLCSDANDYENFKNLGILCASDIVTGHAYSNLITVGQRKAKYHLTDHKFPGLLLKEHRRCAKEIISYCNELCYDNQLIVLTEEKESIYPHMGYAHIKGRQEKNGSSLFNEPEAVTIVDWIVKNQNEILKACGVKSINDCIGIITPFNAQKNIIQKMLREQGLDITKVGTVHSLQGAEKPIVIFSPVYTAEQSHGNFFFDKSPNMLNVAVSRAKNSFLVFGDIDIFDPSKGNKPSSLLAKYLFAKEENEIVNIIQPQFNAIAKAELKQINSLDSHRKALKRSFEKAVKELNIVSPYLRINAIESDSIPSLIKKYSPEININIYVDPALNKGHFQEFNHAKSILQDAGATVILVHNVHCKIIAIDDSIIVQGSFNWFSAARTAEKYMREEVSWVYMGKQAPLLIDQNMTRIKAREKK